MSQRSSYSVAEIAALLGASVEGDSSVKISNIKPLEAAEKEDLSFFAPTSQKMFGKLIELAKASHAGAILIPEIREEISATQIITPNPLGALITLTEKLYQEPKLDPGIHPQAAVEDTAKIGKNVAVGAFAVVGKNSVIEEGSIIHPHVVIYPEVRIGKNCVIHAGAVIRERVILGDNCLIQPGVVIGGDGFGYIPDKKIGHRRITHTGIVRLENGVDIGANSTVDRATFGETHIKENVKIDNLVMIGHNVSIGSSSLLCGQVGISGSSSVGENVTLAGQVGVADHVSIGNNVRAAGKTGITSDVKDGIDIAGHPYQEAGQWRRMQVILKKLPLLHKQIQAILKN